MSPQEPAALPRRRSGGWLFRLKLTLLRLLLAALVLGYGLVWSFQYGPYVAVLMTAGTIALVLMWQWIAERRTARKVRSLLEGRTFPVNLQSTPPVAVAKPDAWLLLRGTPRGMAVDLTNQLLWLLFDHRTIHALRPSGVSSIDIVDDKDFLGKPWRVLRLIDRETTESFRIIAGDEVTFRAAMARLLADPIRGESR